jgi:hypothetical protein
MRFHVRSVASSIAVVVAACLAAPAAADPPATVPINYTSSQNDNGVSSFGTLTVTANAATSTATFDADVGPDIEVGATDYASVVTGDCSRVRGGHANGRIDTVSGVTIGNGHGGSYDARATHITVTVPYAALNSPERAMLIFVTSGSSLGNGFIQSCANLPNGF